MQAVKWTYYGDDSTYTKAVQSYGTKFAADNWMHKSMGIQLGLTDSLRCKLPEDSNGTGYWTVTVYALGYQDFTYNFKVEAKIFLLMMLQHLIHQVRISCKRSPGFKCF